MKEGVATDSGIDTGPSHRYCHTKERWIFHYKLHMIYSNDSTVAEPLSVGFTTANMHYNQIYPDSHHHHVCILKQTQRKHTSWGMILAMTINPFMI